MKNFLSSKNAFTIILLWCIVVFMIAMLGYTFDSGELPIAPFIILGLATALIIWVLLDTRYVIKNNFLLYRSGPFRGRIDITKIRKIKRHSGLYVPVSMKPALDTKGFIITYNNFDDVFVSPQNSDIFLEEIQKINPKVEVV
ncbi:MAG: PH domain-containing protein [Bacteroidota bacterium]